MHPKSLVMHFQKMVIGYYVMALCFGDIRVWTRRVFDILIVSISWMFVQTPVNNIIFWNSEWELSDTMCKLF